MTEQTKYQVRRLKEGDEVVVLTGKSKGETGKITKINFKSGTVEVAGVNVAKRHTRPGICRRRRNLRQRHAFKPKQRCTC